MKKFFSYLILFFLVTSCSNQEQANINNCGDQPTGFVEIEIENNPNFIFENEPNFTPIILNDKEGNSISVNSYLECTHYVKGGWFKPNSSITKTTLNTEAKILLSTIIVFTISLIYLFLISLKKRNLSTKRLLNYSPLIYLLIVIGNIFLKILNRGIYFPTFSEVQLYRYLSLTISVLFFYNIAKLINKLFKINSFSLSITYYLTSFFIFNLALLPITKFLTFSNIFLLVNALWFCTYLIKSKDIKLISTLTINYIILLAINKTDSINLFNNNYTILNNDVKKQWIPIVESIHNNNLFYALEINFIDGYGMLLSYTQAVLHKLLFFDEVFIFNTIEANLVLVLSIFLFADLKISNINKFILCASYFLIVLDDGWLRFILGNSLMLEGIVSFLFTSFIINLNKLFNSEYDFSKKFIFLLFLSSLSFSKQFIEIIALCIIVLALIKLKNNLSLIFSLILLFLERIYKEIFFQNRNSIEYFDGNINDLILDIIFLRDAKWSNLTLIFNKLYEFKFILYTLLLILIFHLINLKKSDCENRTTLALIVFINLLLILILYIFIWKNIETDSSFRYIMNTSHIIFISLFMEFESYQKK